MIVTKKHLSRRTLLRGAGVAVGLPVLDAMLPALGAGPAKTPSRLAFVYVPNGIIMQDWTPKTFGADYVFTRILKPLEPFRADFNILSGIANTAALRSRASGGHARAASTFLSGMAPKKTVGADVQAGVTADQLAARQFGKQTRVPSLQLGCEDTRMVGNCDTGYSCAYTNTVSWKTDTLPLPPEVNPRVVFETLFGTDDPSLDAATKARRALYRRSILDLVQDNTRQLTGTLGPADRRKMDEYLTSVREIEQRIIAAERDTDIDPGLEKPSGIPMQFSDYIKLMYDLEITAFRADLTRVASIMVGREGSIRIYDEIGMRDPHHPLTHHRGHPDFIEAVTKINTYHTEMFACFLGRLKATEDAEGTLLDHTSIVYGCSISDGNSHSNLDIPLLLAGGGNGTLKTGEHVRYPEQTPLTNLWLSLLHKNGVEVQAVGDSTGELEQL